MSYLLNPFIWVILGLTLGLIRNKTWITITSFVFLLIFSNPILSNWILSKWESEPLHKKDLPVCDIAIVLTGMTRTGMPNTDQIHFADGVDRITESIRLYDRKIVNKILVSGGYGSLIDQEIESVILAQMLNSCSISHSDIIVEENSRNTYENAMYTGKKLVALDLKEQRLILVTSAFHMRRSLLCFQKQNIEVIPYPVDYRSKKLNLDFSLLIPSTDSIEIWIILIEEWVGIMAYKIMGYI